LLVEDIFVEVDDTVH